jgi:hypothetical protein
MAEQFRKHAILIRSALIWSQGRASSQFDPVQYQLEHVLSIPRSSSNGYRYRPLIKERNEIRLLRVCPSRESNAQSTFTIEHTSLESAPEYAALSYTWADSKGNSQLDETLVIDGHKIAVTRNLSLAVREIFQAEPGKAFWVDAVCINQTDMEERSNQVNLMKTIYKEATRVVTWLGEEDGNSRLAFQTLRSALEVGVQKTFCDGRWQPEVAMNSVAIEKAWSLIKLYCRSYWERAWIVQETAFARDVVIYCGPDKMEWTDMKAAIIAVRKEFNFLLAAFIDKDVAPHMVTLITGGPICFINCFGEIDDEDTSVREAPLGYLLHLHRYKLSSDPRDKIFSLLGLTSLQMQKRISVNYKISVTDLYINTVTHIIREEKLLNIIMENKRPRVFYRNTDYSLPSWVPCFDYKKGEHLGRIGQFRDAWSGACGSTSLSADVKGRVLTIRGIAVCRITKIGPPMPESVTEVYDFPQVFKVCYAWWKIFVAHGGREVVEGKDSFINIIKCNDWYRPVPEPNNSFWHEKSVTREAQLQEWKEHVEFCKTDARKSLNIVMRIHQPDDNTLRPILGPELTETDPKKIAYAERVTSLATITTTNRCFMVAGGIHFGLAPMCAEVGDVVAVLFGSVTPIVLRERAPELGGGYLNVGDAYLHGFMDGEALVDVEQGVRIVEDFDIH